MQLFKFQLGDGTSYTILFGQLPAASPLIAHYTMSGFRDGYALPLLAYPSTTSGSASIPSPAGSTSRP